MIKLLKVLAIFIGGLLVCPGRSAAGNNMFIYESDTLASHDSVGVAWLGLHASTAMKKIKIDWSTGFEKNNNYFRVQRSIDGEKYTDIGTMAGNGNSSNVNFYSFSDESPVEGISYYKLVQVDYEGKQSSSELIAVNNSPADAGIDQVAISPNPVASSANIKFRCIRDYSVKIEVKNSSGQVCLTEPFDAKKGINTFVFHKANKLNKGIYTFVISHISASSRTVGFIKR